MAWHDMANLWRIHMRIHRPHVGVMTACGDEDEIDRLASCMLTVSSGETMIKNLLDRTFMLGKKTPGEPLRERVVTYQATYTLAGPPELRWGNLKGGVRV